jgi:ribosomal protein L11 methyltransferase
VTAAQPKFTEVTILTHTDAIEGIIDVLLSAGAKGVVEERRPLNVQVTAYLPEGEGLDERVRAIRTRLSDLERQGLRVGPGTIGLRTLEARAWSEAWRDHFEILRITPALTVAPAWEEYEPAADETVIVLEPGAAFGTGGHPTTRLCLASLVRHLRPGDRMADVGCGSGILAVTAALLGASPIIATDNDRTALPVAMANADRNNVAGQIEFVEADLLPERLGAFDLITCNIVAEEVLRLTEGFPALLTRGGRFIASGFMTTALPRIEDALERAQLSVLETPGEEGWAACVAVRPKQTR